VKPKIECCFSPALLDLYDFKNSIVVVIDVFRATSTIAAAMSNGAQKIIPVDDVQKCIQLGSEIENSITAGERNGVIAEGLAMGNSPSVFSPEIIENKTLVLTTTNGTRLLHMCRDSKEIVSASFLNLSATVQYLREQKQDVLLACASWKNRFNLEDSLFAGAVYKELKDEFEMDCDSVRAAYDLYKNAEGKLYEYIQDSAHFNRLSKLGLQADMEYCCSIDKHDVLIRFDGEALIS